MQTTPKEPNPLRAALSEFLGARREFDSTVKRASKTLFNQNGSFSVDTERLKEIEKHVARADELEAEARKAIGMAAGKMTGLRKSIESGGTLDDGVATDERQATVLAVAAAFERNETTSTTQPTTAQSE